MKTLPCRCKIRTTHTDVQYLRDGVATISSKLEFLRVSCENMNRYLYDVNSQVHRLTPSQIQTSTDSLTVQIRKSLVKQLAQGMVEVIEQWEGPNDAGKKAAGAAAGQRNRLSFMGDPAQPWRSRRAAKTSAALS